MAAADPIICCNRLLQQTSSMALQWTVYMAATDFICACNRLHIWLQQTLYTVCCAALYCCSIWQRWALLHSHRTSLAPCAMHKGLAVIGDIHVRVCVNIHAYIRKYKLGLFMYFRMWGGTTCVYFAKNIYMDENGAYFNLFRGARGVRRHALHVIWGQSGAGVHEKQGVKCLSMYTILVYIYIVGCIHIYIYVCILCIYILFAHVNIHVYVHIYAYIHLYLHIHVYVYVYVFTYISSGGVHDKQSALAIWTSFCLETLNFFRLCWWLIQRCVQSFLRCVSYGLHSLYSF